MIAATMWISPLPALNAGQSELQSLIRFCLFDFDFVALFGRVDDDFARRFALTGGLKQEQSRGEKNHFFHVVWKPLPV